MGVALAALFMLTACNALTGPKPETGSGEIIPQGMGLARIRLDAGGAAQSVRTAVPDIEGYYYTLDFTAPGKTEVKKTLDGGLTLTVILDPVVWTLEVKGYADSEMSTLKVRGSTSILITEGTVSSFDVYLTPDLSSGGEGSLYYSISFPATVSRAFLVMDPLDAPGTSREIDISSSAGGTATGTLDNLGEGTYQAVIDLYDGANNQAAVWAGVAHIYDGLSTTLNHTFTAANFAACPPVVGGSTLADKLDTALASPSGVYTIVLDGAETDLASFAPKTLTVTDNRDIAIIIKGSGNEVQLGSAGSLFTLGVDSGSSLKLVFQDLTFRGLGRNNVSLVRVDSGGALEMKAGSIITGNTSTSGGGGVYVADGGIFTMHGGAVSGNTSSYSGGGVYIADSGTFTMYGGAVSGNTSSSSSSSSGGGVNVYGGTFTMYGGTVSGNTSSHGGGVYVADSGIFTMHGGAVSGNTSTSGGGGGVYVTGPSGIFTMHDGTVSGNTATGNNYTGSLGGGVSVTYYGTFIMNSGSVSSNTSSSYDGCGVSVASYGTFIMNSGSVNGNTRSGVRVAGWSIADGSFARGTFTMNDGSVSGNTDGGVLVGGVLVGNGTFSMHGGSVSGNIREYGAGEEVLVETHGTFIISGAAWPERVCLYSSTEFITISGPLSGGTVPIDLEFAGTLSDLLNKPVLKLDDSYSTGNLASLKEHFTLGNAILRAFPYKETPITGYKIDNGGLVVVK
jgi:hypothetical protein